VSSNYYIIVYMCALVLCVHVSLVHVGLFVGSRPMARTFLILQACCLFFPPQRICRGSPFYHRRLACKLSENVSCFFFILFIPDKKHLNDDCLWFVVVCCGGRHRSSPQHALTPGSQVVLLSYLYCQHHTTISSIQSQHTTPGPLWTLGITQVSSHLVLAIVYIHVCVS
jgi:hypothetical protein